MGIFNRNLLGIFRISTLFWTVGVLARIYWCFGERGFGVLKEGISYKGMVDQGTILVADWDGRFLVSVYLYYLRYES